jgi:hypothetical protein
VIGAREDLGVQEVIKIKIGYKTIIKNRKLEDFFADEREDLNNNKETS